MKLMVRIALMLEGSHVGTEPKETDDFEEKTCSTIVEHREPPVLEQSQLLINREWRLAERFHAQLRAIKNPHDLSLPSAGVGIGLAGMLRRTLGYMARSSQ